jgi:hypothetical protein
MVERKDWKRMKQRRKSIVRNDIIVTTESIRFLAREKNEDGGEESKGIVESFHSTLSFLLLILLLLLL